MSSSVKKDELLKAVADVLDEAIATYEQLEKMDLDMKEVEDPSKAKKSEPEASPMAVADEAKEEEEEKDEDEKEKKDMDKASLQMKKEEDAKEEDKEEEHEDEKDDEESDDKLMATYKSLVSKMEKRGLIKHQAQDSDGSKSMKKSEASEEKESKGEEKIEALKKSFDERVEDLTKKIEGIAKAVESISKSPATTRRGLSGATPLRKSETETKPSVSKLEALDKLVELRKSGDQRVDTGLITRLEMGKLTRSDYERLNSILG
jgi:hypothetical protein